MLTEKEVLILRDQTMKTLCISMTMQTLSYKQVRFLANKNLLRRGSYQEETKT